LCTRCFFCQDDDGDCRSHSLVSSSSPALQLTCDADEPVTVPVPPIEHVAASSSSEENVQTMSFHEIIAASVEMSAGSARNTRQKRKVAHAAIVTSSPFKQALEEVQNTKEVKKRKKENKDKMHKKKASKVDRKSMQENKIKKVTKTSREKSRKNKSQTVSKAQDDEEDCRCLYCQELYSESVDVWICCRVCYQWAHELCAGKDNDSTDFVCELCLG